MTLKTLFWTLSASCLLLTSALANPWQNSGTIPITPQKTVFGSDGTLYVAGVKVTISPSFQPIYTTVVAKSTDQGATFQTLATGLATGMSSIGTFKQVQGELWIGGQNQFLRSTDGGVTWISTTGPATSPVDMTKEGSDFYAVAENNSTFKSTDSGVTWVITGSDRNTYPGYVTLSGRRIYRGTVGIEISDNGGVTRTPVLNMGGVPGDIVSFGGRVFSHRVEAAELYRSSNNGSTWETLPTVPGFPNLRIRELFFYDGRLFATTSSLSFGSPAQLLYSDNGDQWAAIQMGNTPSSYLQSGAIGQNLIVSDGSVVKRVRAGGSTGQPEILVAPAGTTVGIGSQYELSAFAIGGKPLTYQWYEGASGDTSQPISGATFSVYKTPPLQQSGDYWVRVSNSSGSIDSLTTSVTAMEIWTEITSSVSSASIACYGPFLTPNGLKLLDRQQDKVFTSLDNGLTWDAGVAWPIGVGGTFFTASTIVNYSNGMFLAARRDSVNDADPEFASSSDGITWTPLGDFPGNNTAVEIVKNGSSVFVSDSSLGFYRSTDGGLTFALSNSGLPSNFGYDLVQTGTGRLVMAGNNRSVSVSDDGGLTWSPRKFVAGNNINFTQVSDLLVHNGIIFAASNKALSSSVGQGLWKSADNGETWTQFSFPTSELESVTFAGDQLVVSTIATPPVFSTSVDLGQNFTSLTNIGLEGINPGEMMAIGDFIFVSAPNGTRLFRLRVKESSGEQVQIVSQPQDATVGPDGSATLTVEVEGEGPVTYQWFNGSNGFGVMVGTNSSSYTTNPAIDYTTTYFVRVTNGFGEPIYSRTATVTSLPGPSITYQFRDKAYFEGTTPTFGPGFSVLTPPSTTFQWYRGETGDTSQPISGASQSKIGPPNVMAGDRVWLRATANGKTADSASGSFSMISWTGGTVDLISRDPDGHTWDEAANSSLAENGSHAFFGGPDTGEESARFPLPYSGPQTVLDENGQPADFPTETDISDTGRFLLFDSSVVYDAVNQVASPAFNRPAGPDINPMTHQISRSGRYLLFSSGVNNIIPNDTNDHVDLFIHDRQTGTIRGITRFDNGTGNQSVSANTNFRIDAQETTVFFGHYATDPLIPGENSVLYTYDIATNTLDVPLPLRGKGPYASFRDASGNGRFILFSWNPQITPLRPTETTDLGAPRHFFYVLDRETNEISFVEIPFGAEYCQETTVSDDGRTISFIHQVGTSIITPYVSHRQPNTDLWATKLLLNLPETGPNAFGLQMSEDGRTFLFNSTRWSLLTPQYSEGSSSEFNVPNVMVLSGFSAGVQNPPTYGNWETDNLSSVAPALRQPAADANGDGNSNWMEFLSGRNGITLGGPLLTMGTSGPLTTVKFRQRIDAPANLIPQFSQDLGASAPWVSIAHLELDRVEVEPGVLEITVRAPLGFENAASQFYRLGAP
jgi:hypothetical protein